jgi:hypothetical protein
MEAEYERLFRAVWGLAAKVCIHGEMDLGDDAPWEWAAARPRATAGKAVLPAGWAVEGSRTTMPLERLAAILLKVRNGACEGLEKQAMDTMVRRVRECPQELGGDAKPAELRAALEVFGALAESLKAILEKERSHTNLDSRMRSYHNLAIEAFGFNETIAAIEDALGREAEIKILNEEGEGVARTITRRQIMEMLKRKMVGEVAANEGGYVLSLPGTSDIAGREDEAVEAFRAMGTAHNLLARMLHNERAAYLEKFGSGENGEGA